MRSAIEVFEVVVDGCKHDANARNLAAAQDLAAWCHGRGYCYHTAEPECDVTVTTWSGNQPPRREESHAVVVSPWVLRYTDGPASGREMRVSDAWLDRHARPVLDPTPPGPPPTGDQPTLFDLLETA